MRIIPVLDIQHGKAVCAIGGRREEYRALTSLLTSTAEPSAAIQALKGDFAPREVYVADLDAIAGRTPAWTGISRFGNQQLNLWIDAGIRTIDDLRPLVTAHLGGIVLGLETISGPEVVKAAIHEAGAEQVIFSLDLRGGRMLGRWESWNARDDADWRHVVAGIADAGVKRLILLDLERVGEGRGVGTESMCESITREYPHIEVICGGGVRGVEDLRRLQDCGASAALVASALHDGRIKPGDWPPPV